VVSAQAKQWNWKKAELIQRRALLSPTLAEYEHLDASRHPPVGKIMVGKRSE